MDMARAAATRSKDPNTNVGAVIVDEDHSVIETGYNGFAPRIKETEERWQRPLKYDYVIHAEQNAIGRAAKAGKRTNGAHIYVTHFPCKECAKMIIAAGIKHVHYDGTTKALMTDDMQKAFVERLFEEAGITVMPYL